MREQKVRVVVVVMTISIAASFWPSRGRPWAV